MAHILHLCNNYSVRKDLVKKTTALYYFIILMPLYFYLFSLSSMKLIQMKGSLNF